MALVQFTAGVGTPQTDAALGIDDALPGYVGKFRQRMEGIADQPGVTRQASKGCDIAVGGDAACGDQADSGINALVLAEGIHAKNVA